MADFLVSRIQSSLFLIILSRSIRETILILLYCWVLGIQDWQKQKRQSPSFTSLILQLSVLAVYMSVLIYYCHHNLLPVPWSHLTKWLPSTLASHKPVLWPLQQDDLFTSPHNQKHCIYLLHCTKYYITALQCGILGLVFMHGPCIKSVTSGNKKLWHLLRFLVMGNKNALNIHHPSPISLIWLEITSTIKIIFKC